ncbi:PQQ-dependent sugar dehydrogenase [Ottowia sp.]|uniref:PQQ-dependent sugar dehydrogenase n=1 Tax=Ottowia sp. TaxID=1898956 RepID=UPI0039322984
MSIQTRDPTAGAERLARLCVLAGALVAAPLVWAQSATPQVQTVVGVLDHPWAVAFLPGGRFLVTERPGRLRVVESDGTLRPPVAGLPAVAAGGQGGLLDVVTDSRFAANGTIYFCFSEPGPNGTNGTALARARLSDDRTRLEDVQVIFSQQPKVASRLHFGCRIVERMVGGQPDGTLFLTLGERFTQRDAAQKLDNDLGKIVRVGKDGSIPPDNPFVGKAGARPEIWSYGHRNVQGATLAADDTLWTDEHGPMGGDEINLPQAGKNYGWPLVSFGLNYDGTPVGTGQSAMAGTEPPLHHWTPSIAPSGMAFLTSERYGPQWRGNLFVGSLKFKYLDRIELKDGRVVAEHKLLQELGQRIRDVRQGPDGLLYVLTDESDGRLLRLLPN